MDIVGKIKVLYDAYKFNKKTPIVCAWCGLVKELNAWGVRVWPERWLPNRCFTGKGSRLWNEASHGMCPECFEKEVGHV